MDILCGGCGKTLKVEDAQLGNDLLCPNCGRIIRMCAAAQQARGDDFDSLLSRLSTDENFDDEFLVKARLSLKKKMLVVCGSCKERLTAQQRLAGKISRCPACGEQILIPNLVNDEAVRAPAAQPQQKSAQEDSPTSGSLTPAELLEMETVQAAGPPPAGQVETSAAELHAMTGSAAVGTVAGRPLAIRPQALQRRRNSRLAKFMLLAALAMGAIGIMIGYIAANMPKINPPPKAEFQPAPVSAIPDMPLPVPAPPLESARTPEPAPAPVPAPRPAAAHDAPLTIVTPTGAANPPRKVEAPKPAPQPQLAVTNSREPKAAAYNGEYWTIGARWDLKGWQETPSEASLHWTKACSLIKKVAAPGGRTAYCGVSFGPLAQNKAAEVFQKFRDAHIGLLKAEVEKNSGGFEGTKEKPQTLAGVDFDRYLAVYSGGGLMATVFVGIQNGNCVAYWFVGPTGELTKIMNEIGKASPVTP